MAKKQEKKVEMTRAQKTEATKGIIKELKKRGADEFSTIRIKDIDFEIKE